MSRTADACDPSLFTARRAPAVRGSSPRSLTATLGRSTGMLSSCRFLWRHHFAGLSMLVKRRATPELLCRRSFLRLPLPRGVRTRSLAAPSLEPAPPGDTEAVASSSSENTDVASFRVGKDKVVTLESLDRNAGVPAPPPAGDGWSLARQPHTHTHTHTHTHNTIDSVSHNLLGHTSRGHSVHIVILDGRHSRIPSPTRIAIPTTAVQTQVRTGMCFQERTLCTGELPTASFRSLVA